MSQEFRYRYVLGEVCVGPHIDRPLNVGLIALHHAARREQGWLELRPAEARDLAAQLVKAANEAEGQDQAEEGT